MEATRLLLSCDRKEAVSAPTRLVSQADGAAGYGRRLFYQRVSGMSLGVNANPTVAR